jgi:hypothetical protein
VRGPQAPTSIIRIHVIAVDSGKIPQDALITNWLPESGGFGFDERYRLEVRATGEVTAAVALTDLDDAVFKMQVWKLQASQEAGPVPYQTPAAEPQPEYIVTGTASSAGPGRNFFFAGAGHDTDSTGYIDGFRRAFAQAGLSDFTDTNVSSGTRPTDITTTMALYQGPTSLTIPAAEAVSKGTVAAGTAVPTGQRNLIGYSFGGAVAASVARQLADTGTVIDNLVLIATPISFQFLRGEQIAANIKRVIVVNLPNDIIRPGTSPAILSSVLTVGPPTVTPHFFFAEGQVNQLRREQLARLLFSLGMR